MPQSRNKHHVPIQRAPAWLTSHCRPRPSHSDTLPLTWLKHIFSPPGRAEEGGENSTSSSWDSFKQKAELRCPLTAGSFNPCQGFSVKLLWGVCSQLMSVFLSLADPKGGAFFRVVLMCLPPQNPAVFPCPEQLGAGVTSQPLHLPKVCLCSCDRVLFK